ncbi:MAG TPA: hypothetical protein PKK10_01055 [Woeseiaceae bacterium]|nr:hypothetical protein [Woeseiaceae bacterium]
MYETISRIKNITPVYPVRPTQPVQPGKGDPDKKGQQQPAKDKHPSASDEADSNQPPTIDEHV